MYWSWSTAATKREAARDKERALSRRAERLLSTGPGHRYSRLWQSPTSTGVAEKRTVRSEQRFYVSCRLLTLALLHRRVEIHLGMVSPAERSAQSAARDEVDAFSPRQANTAAMSASPGRSLDRRSTAG